jgi:TM2 domain-containing membrane protein YozV
MKDKTTTALLALFLGGLGVHRFYLGRTIGILYLLFCWTLIPSLIGFIEFIVFLAMDNESFNRSFNTPRQYTHVYNQPAQPQKMNAVDEIDKLFALKEKGAITEEEFQAKKAKLL